MAEWIHQGGGLMMDIVEENQNVHFIIERHGLISNFNYLNKCTVVSSHWIRSCLEVRDFQFGHIIYELLLIEYCFFMQILWFFWFFRVLL